MTGRIAAFILTLLLNIAAGVAIFFFMLLAMNGFSESDANYGLVTYIVMSLVVTMTMAFLSSVVVGRLLGRNFGTVSAVAISVLVFSVVGIGLKIICSIVGILIADHVRTNY